MGPIYHRPTRRSLVEFFDYAAERAVADIVIYNSKSRQGYSIAPDDSEERVRSVLPIVGIKGH